MAGLGAPLSLRIKRNVDDREGTDWPIPANIDFRTVLVSSKHIIV